MMPHDWSRLGRTRAIALGASLLFSTYALAACGAEPSKTSSSSSDDDDEDDDGSDDDGSSTTKRDAGKTMLDAGKSSADAGRKSDASTSGGDASGGGTSTASAQWCKVKTLFEKQCNSCHDGEGTAGSPMGLVTYADTQADSPLTDGEKVFETIGTRIHDTKKPMPPKGVMSAADLKLVDDWIAAGAKAGSDPSCSNKSVEGGEGVEGGGGTTAEAEWPAECEPKYRYKLLAHGAGATTPVNIPRGAETHPQVSIDAPWGNESVQAIAMRSITDNKKVLHHWILYASSGAFLTGWAPGKEDKDPLPDDVGMYLPSGPRSMRLDMHYFNSTGTQDEKDMSGVEICAVPKALFRKNTATVTMGFASLGQGFVLAPANKMGHESTGTCRVTARQPVHLLTASPHAHTLARAMRFTVTKADGTKITLHEGPFNFEEQKSYPLENEVILNTGDTVTTTCIFDNNTNRNVTFGESTTNEMCFNFALYYPMGALSCGLGI